MAQSSFQTLDKDGAAVTVHQTDDPPEKSDLTALATRLGEVQASPTSNTVLARLKAAVDALGGTLAVDASGETLTINLPSGASTEAKQDSAISELQSIVTALGGTLTVDGSGATQPVSAASLPLPTGAATEATLATLLAPGGTLITTDTSAVTGIDAFQVVCLEATTFSAFTASDCTVPIGTELPAGTIIASTAGITAYTLSSGKVAAYLSS